MVRKSEQRAPSHHTFRSVPFTNCMYAHKKQLGEFDVQKWRRGQGASGQILNGTHSDDDVSRANGLLFKSIFCQAEELFGSFFLSHRLWRSKVMLKNVISANVLMSLIFCLRCKAALVLNRWKFLAEDSYSLLLAHLLFF